MASLAAAARRLAARDPDLARLLARHGPPPMWGRRPGYATLVRIILEQQVSLAAARTLYLRVQSELGGMTPELVGASGIEGLQRLGLTRQKARYCHALAAALRDGRLDLSQVARSPDAVGQRLLLELPGLGPWSVGVYYLMALRRPDVWPPGDLALRVALRGVKRLRRLPDTAAEQRLSARWAPYRSVAARMLWQEYLAGRPRGRSAPD